MILCKKNIRENKKMSVQDLSKNVEAVTANLKIVKAHLQEGKALSPVVMKFISENINYLTQPKHKKKNF